MLLLSKLTVAVPWLLLAVKVAAAPTHHLDARGAITTAPLARSQLTHDSVAVNDESLVARKIEQGAIERRDQ